MAQDRLDRFVKAYKLKDMSTACSLGRQLYRSNIRDENILIATGHACAQDDFIDFIGVLQQRLGQTPNSRKATVYFSTLLLKKRLISEYMFENSDLSAYSLPSTKHILSQVFEAIQSNNFKLIEKKPKHIHIGNDDDYIDVFIDTKLHVNVYEKGKRIKEHQYR